MGCICSKGCNTSDYASDNENELNKSSLQVAAPSSKREEIVVGVANGGCDQSVRLRSKPVLPANMGSRHGTVDEKEKKPGMFDRHRSGSSHKRRATTDLVAADGQPQLEISPTVSMPRDTVGEQPGWPSWLTSVAGEAIQGWVPRSADSFEKLDKIGQGTYSSVYKALDLKTHRTVAMKKVRFVNMDPESVRFMAREILILRKLYHPNVIKLESIVTSRMSSSLYLVFEYMEHDLAGLAASPKIKFTEPQIKCYMRQLLCGLEYCHSRGVLHRDIKGSNLLINNDGVLKIADFGLANFFQPNQGQALTSRVVTLWYRAPELLFGRTDYGVGIDLWSVGCILAELFAGKPIMPGRTEVEQMHKIFKLCGSPSKEYWKKSKLSHASFKPHYRRCIAETFKDFPSSALALIDVLLAIEPDQRGTAASALNSELFTTKPFPCDPSSLPKYLPCKEFDVKLQEEEARRTKAESVKRHGPGSVKTGAKECKGAPSPEFDDQVQISLQGQTNPKSTSVKYNPQEDAGSGFPIDPPRGHRNNGFSQSISMVHPHAVGSSRSKKVRQYDRHIDPGRTIDSSGHGSDPRTQTSQKPQVAGGLSNAYYKDDRMFGKDSTGYVLNKSRIHYSGPLMPPGRNMDDMLREHERQIREAVRKARVSKDRSNKNCYDNGRQYNTPSYQSGLVHYP